MVAGIADQVWTQGRSLDCGVRLSGMTAGSPGWRRGTRLCLPAHTAGLWVDGAAVRSSCGAWQGPVSLLTETPTNSNASSVDVQRDGPHKGWSDKPRRVDGTSAAQPGCGRSSVVACWGARIKCLQPAAVVCGLVCVLLPA